MTKTSGVYIIQCLINNKKYIGSSGDINQRFYRHRYTLKQGKNMNRLLQEDYDLYGDSFFTYSILELVEDNLKGREDYYIELLKSNTIDGGYNITSATGKFFDGEETNKALERKSHYSVYTINCNTGEILKHCSKKQACIDTDIRYAKTDDLLKYWKGFGGKRSCRGYMLIAEEDYVPGFDYIGYKRKQRYTQNTSQRERTVILTNVNTGEQIEKTNIVKICLDEGFVKSKVMKCLKGQPKQYTHHGYYFQYKYVSNPENRNVVI